jgi:hypothetical protein
VVVSLYRASVARLRSEIESGTLVPTLTEQFRHRIGYSPAPAEVRSWERSLQVLSADLVAAGLDQVEALVEYQLPMTSKRADVVLCGKHPRTGEPSYVIVELKQWSRAMLLDGADDICILEGMGERLHPVEQVRRYCIHLLDFAATLEDHSDYVAGAAYLHNATDQDVAQLWELQPGEHGRMFTGQRRGEFIEYLRGKLAPEPGIAAADRLMGTAVRPSKQLLALAAEEVQNREQFVLLDQQQTAYSLVMRAVEQARSENSKEVIIVSGGPGSGKSVIALSLMGELSRKGRSVLHATGSKAFTQTLRRVAGWRQPRVRGMFKYFNQFIDAERNGIDVLILDEAHRIRETSANRYTTAALRSGRPQVEELIDAARVPVFLLDEFQVVRPGEIGTVHDIEQAAKRLGVTCRVVPLDGQFRCGGSRAYEHWVLRLLELEGDGPVAWEGDENFVLSVADAPSVMEAQMRSMLADGYGARMAAGYCWKWSDPVPGGLVADIEIDGWHKPWNNKKDSSHAGAPGTPFWASDPAGFEQVGCVYTAQGFEYDYAGVIFGPDLVWRTDRWVARPEFSHDTQVKRGSAIEFDGAVRNTYKVLLTRGMLGTMLYSTDRETQELLQSLVPVFTLQG